MNILSDLKRTLFGAVSELAARRTHTIEIGYYGNGKIEHKLWRNNHTQLIDRPNGKPAAIVYGIDGKIIGESYCEHGVWLRRIRYDHDGKVLTDMSNVDGQWQNTPRPMAKATRAAARLAAC